MKFFSTLLNSIMPIAKTARVMTMLTPHCHKGINAPPKNAYRKISITAVIGFIINSIANFLLADIRDYKVKYKDTQNPISTTMYPNCRVFIGFIAKVNTKYIPD